MSDAAFVWFPRRQSPAFYDRLVNECFRGGLKTPNIVQEAVDQSTMLSLVSYGLGVSFVTDAARWRCPRGVVLLPVVDLSIPLTLSLVWRKDNTSPLLANFAGDVRRLPDVRTLKAFHGDAPVVAFSGGHWQLQPSCRSRRRHTCLWMIGLSRMPDHKAIHSEMRK